MADKLPKDPGRVWRNVIAAVAKAMRAMDFQDVDELRAELVKYQRNLVCPPAARLPQGEDRRQLCVEVWDALLGMGFGDPLMVLDYVAEKFFQRPDLAEMQQAVERYDKRGSWTAD